MGAGVVGGAVVARRVVTGRRVVATFLRVVGGAVVVVVVVVVGARVVVVVGASVVVVAAVVVVVGAAVVEVEDVGAWVTRTTWVVVVPASASTMSALSVRSRLRPTNNKPKATRPTTATINISARLNSLILHLRSSTDLSPQQWLIHPSLARSETGLPTGLGLHDHEAVSS